MRPKKRGSSNAFVCLQWRLALIRSMFHAKNKKTQSRNAQKRRKDAELEAEGMPLEMQQPEGTIFCGQIRPGSQSCSSMLLAGAAAEGVRIARAAGAGAYRLRRSESAAGAGSQLLLGPGT